MPRVIVPVGLAMGPRYRYVRPPDPVPECYEVHLADDLVELSEMEAAVWQAAFVDMERHAKLEVNRESLIEVVHAKPRPGAEETVDGLIGRGLLLEFDPDGDLAQVFSRHKLFPLGQGLGATPEDPHLHRVGFANQPVIALRSDVLSLWSFSLLHPHLWDACTYYAAADVDDLEEEQQPLGLTPEGIARDVAGHLPLMIAAGCAFLDPVVSP
jgi:hypothetical protein